MDLASIKVTGYDCFLAPNPNNHKAKVTSGKNKSIASVNAFQIRPFKLGL